MSEKAEKLEFTKEELKTYADSGFDIEKCADDLKLKIIAHDIMI